jgi:chorismate mutase-like protein
MSEREAPGQSPDDAAPGATDPITRIRTRIDAIDERIQSLIDERARIAREVGASKESTGAIDYYRPEREAQVLRKVLARNGGPLRDDEMLRLFREIMSACLAQQAPLKVSFLGPEGTLTRTAVTRFFGHSVRALPLPGVEGVFREVETGSADFGVVPVESCAEGAVQHTFDIFVDSPLKICGEIEVPLLHPPAEGDDRPGTTRFHVIGRTLLAPSGDDRTTIVMSGGNTEAPGALYRLLEPLARHGVSMSRIESRPSRKRMWRYVFFVDLDGHAEDPKVAAALRELERIASLFKVLGAYPRSVEGAP